MRVDVINKILIDHAIRIIPAGPYVGETMAKCYIK